jgi:hypothetical protein
MAVSTDTMRKALRFNSILRSVGYWLIYVCAERALLCIGLWLWGSIAVALVITVVAGVLVTQGREA